MSKQQQQPQLSSGRQLILDAQAANKDKWLIGIAWQSLRNLVIATDRLSEQAIAVSGTIEKSIELGNSAILNSLDNIAAPK